ncbi:hypothetical protein llap_2084 [Limosa lapponica baueri]|uniref:Uncharacterized protein n=1 Tax=Limosa lapponica baueri TaxID=1758121 RepID=A0A2I0UNI3_LIMLA|nr:hypothetical protein llap_2084 [Limosa lapponica baueri]
MGKKRGAGLGRSLQRQRGLDRRGASSWESYVKEVSNDKENMILINKADLLSEEQRAAWARFFEKEGVKVVFWSALAECRRLSGEEKEPDTEGVVEDLSHSEDESSSQEEDDDTVQDSAESTSMGNASQTVNQVLTLYVEPGLCLCDCPGLVMPSFISTKAEMICSGILPIDQMRDHVPPISLISFAWAYVCQHIPRNILEATYGINIIRPREDEDPDRTPTAEELLTAYGYMRGFMTSHGQPDQPRSARYVLKDYVSGKLLYCHPPPGIDPNDFQHQHQRCPESGTMQASGQVKPEKNTKAKQIENVVDKTFFHQENVRALVKGVRAAMGYRPGSGLVPVTTPNPGSVVGKPWKKHGNRNKKEKIRRITKHLEA